MDENDREKLCGGPLRSPLRSSFFFLLFFHLHLFHFFLGGGGLIFSPFFLEKRKTLSKDPQLSSLFASQRTSLAQDSKRHNGTIRTFIFLHLECV